MNSYNFDRFDFSWYLLDEELNGCDEFSRFFGIGENLTRLTFTLDVPLAKFKVIKSFA